MARVFVTGSSTGLALMAAQLLLELGHRVVVHGRNPERADAALASVPGADGAVVGDLSSIRGMRSVANRSTLSAGSMPSSTMPASATAKLAALRRRIASPTVCHQHAGPIRVDGVDP